MQRWTPSFAKYETVCPCGCGKNAMDPLFMARAQAWRDEYDKPIHIVSGGGFRCANFEPSDTSAHRIGMALDPSNSKEEYFQLIKAAILVGMTGIIVKNFRNEFQLHIDAAPEIFGIRPRPYFGTYPFKRYTAADL